MSRLEAQQHDDTDELIGQQIAGRYEVLRRLGQGGMGVVYAARQAPLGRTVAIKVLLEDLTMDPIATQRFEKEALAISRLAHPNIVTIFDFGQTKEGLKYIVMEFLDGRSLRDVLNEGPLSPKRCVRVIMHICRALSEAHKNDVIHRDLKPDNIMLVAAAGEPDFLKVLDFGVAKLKKRDGEQAATLTQTDIIIGTPKYMAPEQVNGITDDPRSDLYSLGAIAFELLTGRVPFDGESAVKILVKHLQEQPPALRDVHPACKASDLLEGLVMQLLKKDPAQRPSGAVRVLELLEDLPEYTGPRRAQTVANAPVYKTPGAPAPSTKVAAAPVAAPAERPPSAPNLGVYAPTQKTNLGDILDEEELGVAQAPRTVMAAAPHAAEEVDDVFTHTRLPRLEKPAAPPTPPRNTNAKPRPAPSAGLMPPTPSDLASAPTPAAPQPAASTSRMREPRNLAPPRAPAASKGRDARMPLALWFGGAGLLLLGLSASVAVLLSWARPETPVPVEAAPPAPAIPAEPVPAPVADVAVTSEPAGAEVLEAGAVIGVTPFNVRFADDGKTHLLTLRKAGFEAAEQGVTAGDTSVVVKLRAIEVERAAPAETPRAKPRKEQERPRREEKARAEPEPAPPPKQDGKPRQEEAPKTPEKRDDGVTYEKFDDLKDPAYGQ